MITGGMLRVKFSRGLPLRHGMYSSAEPTLVCKVLSPSLTPTGESESDKWYVWIFQRI